MDEFCEFCEFCGKDSLVRETTSAPYGWGEVSHSWYTCDNPECLGDKEPTCDCCGCYAYQAEDDELLPVVVDGDPEKYCSVCKEEFEQEKLKEVA